MLKIKSVMVTGASGKLGGPLCETLVAAGPQAGVVLAGGTDLLGALRDHIHPDYPGLLVDLKRLPGLDHIALVGGALEVGALVSAAGLAAAPVVWQAAAALAEAAGTLGSPPVRRLATIGGNVGRASPASDLLPALLVHEARALIAGAAGIREAPVGDLLAGPGTTTLGRDEIITGLVVPPGPEGSGAAYRKLGRRSGGWDLALVGVAARLTLDASGRVAGARLALASVGPTVLRCEEAEACLVGRAPDDDGLAQAAAAAAAAARPVDDIRASAAYRRVLTRVLTFRVLEVARERARGAPR